MRTRVFKNDFGYKSISFSTDGEGIYAVPWSNLEYQSEYDVLTDRVTPGFMSKSNKGALIVNPFTRTHIITEPDTSEWHYKNIGDLGNDSFTASGAILDWLITTQGLTIEADVTIDGDDDISHIKQDVIASVDAAKYAFGEDLAEFRKTLTSVKEIMSDLAHAQSRMIDYANQLRRGGMSFQKAMSKTWLRARYEVRPLIITADNLIEIINEGLKAKRYERVARSGMISRNQTSIGSTGTSNYDIEVKRHTTIEGRIGAGCYFKNSDPRTGTLEQLGLSAKDLLPTVWAVTRFSFLVDRFIDISSMIYGLENLLDPSIQIFQGWNTISTKTESTYTFHSCVAKDTSVRQHVSFSGSAMVHSTENKSRSLWTPSIEDTLPSLQLPGWDTWVDILAIFHGNKKSLRL